MKTENGYTSNLDMAAGTPIKTIKGIESFLLGQRLKYKGVLDPEEQITFQSALNNNDAYETPTSDDGIESSSKSENNNYLTLQDLAGGTLRPNPSLGNAEFLHRYPIENLTTNEETGGNELTRGEEDTSVTTREPASIDILEGPNDNKEVYKTGPMQVLKGNTMDEFYQDQGNINIPGLGEVNVLGSIGLGGMVSQASTGINSITNLIGLGDVINKQDDDPLYADNSTLDTKKNAYLKSINLQYANSKVYNRLTNVANSAASAANIFAPQNFNFDINHDSLGQPFVNWWSNVAGDSDLNPTFLELLELDTANFNTMSLMNAKPQIAVKYKKDQRVKGGLVDKNGIRQRYTDSALGHPKREIESGGEDLDNNGLALNVFESKREDPPRLDTYREDLSFTNVANYNYTRAFNSFGYPEASQSFEKSKYFKFLDDLTADLYNGLNINIIRPDNDLRTIKHLLNNTFSHTITENGYNDIMRPYYSSLKSDEEKAQIAALIEKNDVLKELGYLYVRPYPGTFKYVKKGEDGKDVPGSFNFENFTIPFEFQPKISEASTTVQYATEEMLNHTGSLRTYIRTEPGVVTLETEYFALCENQENYLKIGINNDISKNFGVDAWQYMWDLNRIDMIEKAYRSLAFPVNSQSSVTPGIIKPPMIKILMQTDKSKELTVGNLYRYPYTNYNSDFNWLGSERTNGYYLQNMQIDNKDNFRTYKTYICTDVNINYDDEKYAMVVPSAFKTKAWTTATRAELVSEGETVEGNAQENITTATTYDDTLDNLSANPIYKIQETHENNYYRFRGFKVTLNLVEITENYLDAIPDFAAYYEKFNNDVTTSLANYYNSSLSDTFKGLNRSAYNDFIKMKASDVIAMATEIGNIKELEIKYRNQQIIIQNALAAAKTELDEFNKNNQENIDLVNDYYKVGKEAFEKKELLEDTQAKATSWTQNVANKLPDFEGDIKWSTADDEGYVTLSKSLSNKYITDENKEQFETYAIKMTDSKGNVTYRIRKEDFDDYIISVSDVENKLNDDVDKATKEWEEKNNDWTSKQDEIIRKGLNDNVEKALPNGTMFTGMEYEYLNEKQKILEAQVQEMEKNNDAITSFIGGTLSNGDEVKPEASLYLQAKEKMNDYIQQTSSNFLGYFIGDTGAPKPTDATVELQNIVNEITTQINNIPG